MKKFKGGVSRNARKQIRVKERHDRLEKKWKERLKEKRAFVFRDTINKSRKYQWKEEINVVKFFCFAKPILKEYGLGQAALAVYPVLCSKADFKEDKWFELSQKIIGELAGIGDDTASKGIRELMEAGLVKRKKETKGLRHVYEYKVDFIRKPKIKEWEGNYFVFHTCIIESGIWAKLKKPRAKVLYLALRSKAEFEKETYAKIENIDDEYDVYLDYSNRKWDFYYGSLAELCEITGIARSNINDVLGQLEKYRLVEKYDRNYFMVYLKPEITGGRTRPLPKPKAQAQKEEVKTTSTTTDGRTVMVEDGMVDIITKKEYME